MVQDENIQGNKRNKQKVREEKNPSATLVGKKGTKNKFPFLFKCAFSSALCCNLKCF